MGVTANILGIRQCQGEPEWSQIKENRLQVAPTIGFVSDASKVPRVGPGNYPQWTQIFIVTYHLLLLVLQ